MTTDTPPLYLVLLADARRARFLELHLGQSCELGALEGDFTGAGLDVLAARADILCRDRRADRLVLGCDPSLQSRLIPLLPAPPRRDLILEPLLGPDLPPEAVVGRIAHHEREARKTRQTALVERFLDEVRQGGAVAGLKASTSVLQQGCARLLLVRAGYAKMGRCCPACGRLSVDHRSCPWCFRPTAVVLDLVEELADRAAAAGVEIFRVSADARFDAAGGIGVELFAGQGRPRPT